MSANLSQANSQRFPIEGLLNERDVARIIGLSISSVRRWRVHQQGPKYLKVGGAVRYRPADLQTYLDSRPAGGDQTASTSAPAVAHGRRVGQAIIAVICFFLALSFLTRAQAAEPAKPMETASVAQRKTPAPVHANAWQVVRVSFEVGSRITITVSDGHTAPTGEYFSERLTDYAIDLTTGVIHVGGLTQPLSGPAAEAIRRIADSFVIRGTEVIMWADQDAHTMPGGAK